VDQSSTAPLQLKLNKKHQEEYSTNFLSLKHFLAAIRVLGEDGEGVSVSSAENISIHQISRILSYPSTKFQIAPLPSPGRKSNISLLLYDSPLEISVCYVTGKIKIASP
jgi:hypothetical protein